MINVSKQVQAAYDQIVEAYAGRNHGDMPEDLVRLARKLLQHIGPTAHIIEVGCGTGRDMAWFEAQGVRVTGVDLSSGMLAYARREVNGPLLMQDMRRLAFRSHSFAGAWSCASLLHLPKPEAPAALQEMRRVLKPGGMLTLSIQEGDFEGWESGYVAGINRFFARYREAEMTALLARCGFTTGDVDRVQANNRDWLSFVCLAIGNR